MIAKLRGLVDSVGDDWTVMDVGGVGYLVFASARTLSRLQVRETAHLVIETHVREDHIHLYGFSSEDERSCFRLLLTVQGVGTKVALAILSLHTPHDVARILASSDKVALTRAAGVGPKLAGRILAELKEKCPAFGGTERDGVSWESRSVPSAHVAPKCVESDVTGDAVSALVNLGYGRADAFSAVAQSVHELGETATVPSLLSTSLRRLGQEH